MKYTDLVTLLSEARMSKYNRVTHGEKMKTIQLYHHNLKLSQRLFGVIGMFEVALRNAIHNHYRNSFDDMEWIVNQAAPGKLLEHEADEVLRVKNDFIRKGVYSADKMVASFSFGFWTYLFTRRNYKVGGKTLLQIFPNRCKGLKQTDVYNDLTQIREFRNRIAHHEPICFDADHQLSTAYACRQYALIRTYLEYMGHNADKVLKIVEKPDSVLREMDRLAEEMKFIAISNK